MTNEPDVIRLGDPMIDLAESREPTLVEVVTSSAVRRTAARALHDLEAQHDHGPWVVICSATSELIAASPSYEPLAVGDWSRAVATGLRLERRDVPLAVIGLEVRDVDDDAPVRVAADWVLRSLAEIVLAERRAAIADARAGRAEALAATDALTGVGNQRAWWDRIGEEDARIERSHASDVIALVDLDDLKVVNDERGHLHGDLLLRLTAQTLRKAIRACDVVARVGGDEFAVLAVDFEGEPSVLAQRISESLDAADIHASVGVASPTEGMTLVDAYDQADRAMYAQKRRRHETSSKGA